MDKTVTEQTVKVVINKCFGGFGLSPKGIARLAELQGRTAHFFCNPPGVVDFKTYQRVSIKEAAASFMFFAFDEPDANEKYLGADGDWHALSQEQRIARNEEYRKHQIDAGAVPRHDANLVRVVEELGAEANGSCAELAIIEIPLAWSTKSASTTAANTSRSSIARGTDADPTPRHPRLSSSSETSHSLFF